MNRMTRRDALQTGTMLGAGLLFAPHLSLAGEALAGEALAGETMGEGPADMSIIRYKTPAEEAEAIAEMARKLTRAAVDAIGGMERFVSSGQTVWVKPNIGWDRAPEYAADTNPDVVGEVVKMCYEAGAKDVFVGDRPCNDARRSYANSGIQAAAEKEEGRIVFMDDSRFKEADLGGDVLKAWPIYPAFHEADVKINVPIAKHHGLSNMTLTMKNLMGCIGGNRGHLHQDMGTSLTDLTRFFKPDLHIIDAVRVLMRGGPVSSDLNNVKRFDTVAASPDPVALDAWAAHFLDFKPEEIPNVPKGAEAGLGNQDYQSLRLKELTV